MSQKSTVTEHLLAASRDLQIADVLEFIDDLHSAASDGHSQDFTGMTEAEVINYLRDLIYTAQEAVSELETAQARNRTAKKKPSLRIVRKYEKAG